MNKASKVLAVTKVLVAGDYTIEVTFSDGKQGRVNLEDVLWGRAFEVLHDPLRFAQVSVDRDLGVVVWQNGADLSTELLYGRCVTGKRVKRAGG